MKKVLVLVILCTSLASIARPIRGTYNGTTRNPDGTLNVKCKWSIHKCITVTREDGDSSPYSVKVLNPDESLVFEVLATDVIETPDGEDTNVTIFPIP